MEKSYKNKRPFYFSYFRFLYLTSIGLLGISFFLFFSLSCVSVKKNSIQNQGESTGDYSSLSKKQILSQHLKTIKSFTRKKEINRGFYNQFKVWITQLNTEVLDSLLNREALSFHWSRDEFNERRMKADQESSFQSKVVISLFTSEDWQNDLSKGKFSIWKVYLEFENVRYLGKMKRMNRTNSELKILYPHHSHFSSLYEIQFDIPMSRVEQETSKVILTSHLGTVEVLFPPLKDFSFFKRKEQ